VKITGKVTEEVEREVVLDVRCNLCGETCIVDHSANSTRIEETGGWGGTFPTDMERWSLDVCERCIGALFLVCKVQPEVYDASIGCASPMPSGAMWSMLAGEVKCDDARAVVARLEMIVAAATARLASLKPREAT
jgi:hypothetical protein